MRASPVNASKKPTRLGIAQAREKFAAKQLDLLEVSYRDVHTPMAYRCRVCGYEGRLCCNDLQSKNCGCRECGIKRRAVGRRLDFESFKAQQFERGFEILSDSYVNVETKLQARCLKCGHVWPVRAHCLRSDRGCPQCRRRKQSERQFYSADFVASELAKLGITLLSEYAGSQRLICVRFDACGHEVERTYNQLSKWQTCPRCGPKPRATEADYHATAREFGGKALRIASTAHRKSLWLCPLGKHKFERPLSSIRKLKTFCPICTGAYGEMLCRAAVEKLFGKPFLLRKRILGMKSPKGRLLELDIYNEGLRIAVEHHGAHHYRVLRHWSGKVGLQRQLQHDRLRREFCDSNGILLIEVRELGLRTSLEEMRQQIRAALLENGRELPVGFDAADLTSLPQLNASEVYWTEVHQAASKMGLEILSRVFEGAEMPISVRCEHGHVTPKTPRSILQGHRCDACYMEQRKKPLQLSDGRFFESGASAAKVLGVTKEVVNRAVRMSRTLRGVHIERISWEQFRKLSAHRSAYN